ncbi:hypothetical protein [Nonomuraea sp. NEAU-A123]|uniref:hypothetical protein n=1 Tax=Nonomuraea sp. NEAU-A123 TaxID=2839649 RepID=UPI001BE486D1|nr:hypothetical protein [Nonomuraea sp. NEAU-A123]MBT2234749.1 hypothetical protein [Nonomuraea sp. NEAU-A123]
MTSSPDEARPSGSSSATPSSDAPSENPEVVSSDGSSSEGWWWGGGIAAWFFLGAPLIILIWAWATGHATEGPEFDKLFDQYFGWVLFGVPVGLVVVGAFGWGAFSGLSALLARRKERVKRRESILTQRAKGLQTMVREAQEVSRELELYLEERLAALKELSEKVDGQERLASLTPEQVEALNKVLRKQFTGNRRSGLIQQIIFLVLAFLLGFVVNWLSDPMLGMVQRWWS